MQKFERRSVSPCFAVAVAATLLFGTLLLGTVAQAQSPDGLMPGGLMPGGLTPSGLMPVEVDPVPSIRITDDTIADEAIPTRDSRSAELPASITGDNELLPLAPAGKMMLPALPVRSGGCLPRPLVECTGPDYCGCTARIYFGTNPCDDDPILPLYPTINDHKTRHWYQHAKSMVLRKKHVAETLK